MAYDITLVNARLLGSEPEAMPIGPLYLASALSARGRRVELIDFERLNDKNPFNFKVLADAISAAQAPVVGISLFGSGLPVAIAAVEEHRRRGGEKKIVFGGPGPNGVEERLLERFNSVDVVVRGEGEWVLPTILDAFERGEAPAGPGIFARNARGRVQGTPPVRIPDLDALPWPDRSLLPSDRYTQAPLVTARGCPFSCAFCDIITMWGRTVGYRSIDDVVREVEAILATGITKINILDDTFTVNRRRVIAFCRALRHAGLEAQWSCFSRIDLVDDELLDEMVAAGCRSIYFGIDASTEDGWEKINKHLDRDKILATVQKALTRCSIWTSFIWGYPFESFNDFAMTIDFAHEIAQLNELFPHRVTVQLHFLSPEPATPLFAEYGHTLKLGKGMPLGVLGGRSLSFYSRQKGYAECLALIATDPALFSPFFYYPSERLLEKLMVMQEALLPGTANDHCGENLAGDGRDINALSLKIHAIRALNQTCNGSTPVETAP